MCFGRRREENEDPSPRPARMSPSPGPSKASPTAWSKASPAASPTAPPPAYQRSHAGPAAQPPTHDWQTAVPDTALLPPPPAVFSAHDRSPANNATEAEAEAGEAWCAARPLAAPAPGPLDAAAQRALRAGDIRLLRPDGFRGTLTRRGPGRWEVATRAGSPDCCVVGHPPLYVAAQHRHAPRTAYYEVRVLPGSRGSRVALGFAALPYPPFRLPGWHRGSLGVHGDDGRRYVNDRWGGRDFTREFAAGETLGIGMTLTPGAGDGARPRVSVFFTRDGVAAGGWDLHEERDAGTDLPVTGLEGFHDLSCAIGAFDGVGFEVILDPAGWRYRQASAEDCS
ncbi:hypothetical protein UVI_02006490 [Ustilaginoidea virens]|uniref:SPRY domain-containing protein n=1 Tax=Ustilaginoidea virens TaxID=1159556 RepID=A0A1B5KW59_USTVR|nr:hypothetical protein UVI_02006490 [Ustilaginoidea virens]